MSQANEALSTMAPFAQYIPTTLKVTEHAHHGPCQMPKLLDHSIFSTAPQGQSSPSIPVIASVERNGVSLQNKRENILSNVLKGNIKEFVPGNDIKKYIDELENECAIQCRRFNFNYSELNNLEKVMLLRLKLPQEVIHDVARYCELEGTTIDTLTYIDFRNMVLKKCGLAVPLIHIVLQYLGPERSVQRKETSLFAHNKAFLSNLHPCMQPQSDEDCRKFVDLVQRTAYYASLTDPEIQKALEEIPEEYASLKKFMDVSLHKSNLSSGSWNETTDCYTSSKPDQCNELHNVFSDSFQLSNNTTSHTNEVQYQKSPYETTSSNSANIKISSNTNRITFLNSQYNEAALQNNDVKINGKSHFKARLYKCSICEKTCLRNSDLIRHMITHTGERPYQCSLCAKGFSRKGSLKIHMGIHTEERPYKCSHCNKSFLDSTLLGNHMRNHTGERPFKCLKCEKAFKIKSNLKEHMSVHTGEKPHLCSQCGKSFARKTNLKKHMVIHTGERPFQCNQCGMAFSDDRNLIRHKMIHSGDRSYQCSQCPQAFFNNADLIRHIRIHTGERPYQCTQCSKAFRLNNSLILHMRTHTGEKPYKCTQCEKAFSCSTSLKDHMRIHTGEKPYLCNLCGKAFSRKHHLTNHRKTHSKGILVPFNN